MRRNAMAVIAGFFAMSGVASVSFAAASRVLGAEGVLLHGTLDPTERWIAVSLVLGLLVALSGGAVCGSMSPRLAPLCTLAGLAVLIGLAYAGLQPAWEDSGQIPSAVGWIEAQFVVRSPRWLLFANPAIDLIGILLGGAVARRVMHAREVPLGSSIQEDSGPTPGPG